jgi:hypothetical protein
MKEEGEVSRGVEARPLARVKKVRRDPAMRQKQDFDFFT